MPEIKHNFTAGKMNKDLDERLVPNGEYRHAENIQVRTTDNSDAGAVQSIQGNTSVGTGFTFTGYPDATTNATSDQVTKCVGSIADEKSDKGYFFMATPKTIPTREEIIATPGIKVYADVIVEKDFSEPFVENNINGGDVTPVVVDWHMITCDYASAGSPTPSGTFNSINLTGMTNNVPIVGMIVESRKADSSNLMQPNTKITAVSGTTIYLDQEQTAGAVNGSTTSFWFIRPEEDRLLNFDYETEDKITGINIIDDILLWSDGRNEPKKINITRCKHGSGLMGGINTFVSPFAHTQLVVTDPSNNDLVLVSNIEEGADRDLKKEHITVIRKAPTTAPNITMRKTTREFPVQGFISGNFFFSSGTPEVNSIIVIDLDGLYGFRVNDILTFTDYTTEGMNVSITAIVTNVATSESTSMDTITVEISSIDPDLTALNTNWEFVLNQPKPLFELKLGRIGYRYRYDDGEYSTFSPWSELVFQPDSFSYTPSNGYNNGMVNGVREITVRDFIPNINVRPNDVKSVDVLFKTTDDQNVYIIKTITRRIDNEWDNFVDEVSQNTGKIVLTSELIHKVVESKQLLRSWDNVPKKALSQEIVGNRVVYGNYEQGFDIDTFIGLQQQIVSDNTTLLAPYKSVKSIRSYKWGMVFSDEFGRQTPVLSSSYTTGPSANSTNSTGDIVVPKDLCAKSNHFKLTQQWDDEPPAYFSSVSYYVKETSSEYYNLVMDRWYDAEDGNIWLSFPSSDRSKVDEETYLILKNENGNQTAVLEEARYKILAIENDVPEFVKLDQRTMGETDRINNIDIYGATDGAEGMQSNNGATTSGTPDGYKNTLELIHPDGKLKIDEDTFRGDTKWVRIKAVHPASNKKLYSKWVKVARFEFSTSYSGGENTRWANKTILSESFGDEIDFNYTFAGLGLNVGEGTDANFGDMGDGSGIHWFLQYRDDVSESKAEFDGRFFVKIENDSIITSKITKQSNTDYQIVSTYAIAYISMDPDPWFDTWASSLYDGYDPSINNANPNATNQGNSAGTNYTGTDWDDYGTGLNSTSWVHWIWFHPLIGGEYSSDEAFSNWSTGSEIDQNGDGFNDWKFHVISGSSSHVINHAINLMYFVQPWNKVEAFANQFGAQWEIMSMSGAFEGLPYSYNPTPPNNDSIIEDFWMAFDTNGASKIFIDNTPVYNGVLEPGSRGFLGSRRHMESFYTPLANDDKDFFYFKNGSRQNSGLFEGSIDVSQTTAFSPSYPYSDSMYFGTGEEPGGLIVEGTLGGLTFSTLGSGGDVVASFNNLKNTFAGGTYFRFTDDPFGTVYKAIDIKWHIQEMDIPMGGGINSSSIIDNDTYNIEAVGLNNAPQKNFDDDATNYYNRRTSFVIWFRQIENGVFRKQFTSGDSGSWKGYGVETDIWDPRSAVAHNGSTSMKIEILKPVPVTGELFEEEQVTSAACWETEPKKNADMDIYYEASNIVPMRLNEKNIITYTSPKQKVAAFASVSVDRPTLNYNLQTLTWDVVGITPVILPNDCYIDDTVGTAVRIFSNGSPINTVLEAGDIIKFHHPDGTITRSTIVEEVDVDTNGNIVSAPTGLSQQLSGACFSLPGTAALFFFDYDQSNAINSIGLSTLNGAPIQPGWIVTGSNIASSFEIVVQPGGILSQGINTGNGFNLLMLSSSNGQNWDFEYPSQFGFTGAPGSVGQLAYNGGTLDFDIYTITITQPTSGSTGMWKIDTDVYKYAIDLAWHNCYTFGNGVESDRIRDDFNAPTIDNGIKVSTTFLDYKAEKKGSGLIYSGIYNSTSGVNELNEFNMSEKITKDLNPAYGSIQALKTRNTDIVTFCEDKVLKVLANKDALYNADGNTQLTATNRVLGTAIPFAGDYGISKNPESLAWDQYRLYFTDRQRGAVLRLSGDGLTPISNVGMKEWFRDNLRKSKSLLGTFDSVNGEYNLTLKLSENISEFYQDLLKLTNENTTVSFNEASKGWVSFKSFIPEVGLSVSGKYITAVSDEIYLHYDNNALANSFYGTKYDSRIDVLFNDSPSSVKSFKAINYEGSQARVNVFNTETHDGVEYTDSDIYNLEGKEGWWVESFETDLQKGSVREFIEKEGKWFNFIQGVERVVDIETNLDNINTSEFSVQGIGFPINVNVLDDTDGGNSEDGTEIQVVDINDLQPWAAFTFISDQTNDCGIKHRTFGGDGNTFYEREYGDMIMVEMNLYLKGTVAQLPGSNSTLIITLGGTTTTHIVEHNTLYPLSLIANATSDNYNSNFKIEFDAVEAELPNAGATILISQPYHTVLGQGNVPKYQSYPTFSTNPYGSGTILSNIQSELSPYGDGSGTDVYGQVEMNTVEIGTGDSVEIDGWRESNINGSMEYASYEYFPE